MAPNKVNIGNFMEQPRNSGRSILLIVLDYKITTYNFTIVNQVY